MVHSCDPMIFLCGPRAANFRLGASRGLQWHPQACPGELADEGVLISAREHVRVFPRVVRRLL